MEQNKKETALEEQFNELKIRVEQLEKNILHQSKKNDFLITIEGSGYGV
jgi:hypothetical protein